MRAKVLLLCLAAGLTTAGPLTAQAPGVEAPSSSSPFRLHLGMWTTHLTDLRGGFDANWLVAVGWRGYYGGTFVNSFGDRAFALGVERPLSRADEGRVTRGLGYRVGVVTGYDGRLARVADVLPALPALQVTGDVGVGRTGLEVTWTGKVATVGPFMRVVQ